MDQISQTAVSISIMKSIRIATVCAVFAFAALGSCGLRAKQIGAIGLAVATYPVNEYVASDAHPTAALIARASLTTALLVAVVALLEMDVRRNMTGEHVTLRVGGKRPLAGSYVQEVCNHRVLLCLGPYRSFAIRTVKATRIAVANEIGLTKMRDAWLLGAEVVASIPAGAIVHNLESDCPICRDADARAWEDIAPEFDGEDDHDVMGDGVLGR